MAQVAEIRVEVVNSEAVRRLFGQLERAMQKRIMRKAIKAGAQIVLNAAGARAPFRTGQLVRSLKVRSRGSWREGIRYSVETESGDYKGKTFYASFQEFGWNAGKRGASALRLRKLRAKNPSAAEEELRRAAARPRIPGKHFMRQAADSRAERVFAKVAEIVRQEVEAEFGGAAG